MQPITIDASRAKPETYRALRDQLAGLFDGERDGVANSANTAAALYHLLPDLNWVGFYFLHRDELVLGPFQGKVACVRIALGRGVCGTAAHRRETVIVPDVHAFPGHIACDDRTRSELVVPMVARGELRFVLDLDSPFLDAFGADEAAILESLVTEVFDRADVVW